MKSTDQNKPMEEIPIADRLAALYSLSRGEDNESLWPYHIKKGMSNDFKPEKN